MKKESSEKKEQAAPAVDAVFVIGTGSKNGNEELRYALRNLAANCPFVRDVYICGECPDWVDTSAVKHLKWPDRFTHAKDANIIDKLRHACEHEGIAKNILFCSDDQFQTRVCSWDDFAPRWLRQYRPGDPWYADRKRVWHTRLRKTLERDRQRRAKAGLDTSTIYYYQPHIWMPIDRDKFIEYAKWCDYEHRDDTIIASGYFNYINAGGKFNYDHVFISAGQKWPVNATHIAYTDSSFQSAMQYLRSTFKEPCRFELPVRSKAAAPEASATVLKLSGDKPVKIDAIVNLVTRSASVWSNMRDEVRTFVDMLKGRAADWEVVKNDIERRFNAATANGKLNIPVTEKPSPEAAKVVAAFKSGKFTTIEQEKQNVVEAKGSDVKKCSKCEERRRALAAKAADSSLNNTSGVRAEASPFEKTACRECAIDHLSSAVAYLNSNGGNPDPVDVAMAKGEVLVAERHLHGLGYVEELDKCRKAIISMRSEKSTFSADTFYGIVKGIIERK